jgi:hypothetical protein
MCEDFPQNFGAKRTGCCITTTHHFTLFFYQRSFDQNNIIVVRHSPYFFLFPWIKIKLKGHHIDTTEVIEAGLQAVLNTLTDHNFHDEFKNNGRSTENGACSRKGTTPTVMVGSRPRGFLSPGNYGWLLALCNIQLIHLNIITIIKYTWMSTNIVNTEWY